MILCLFPLYSELFNCVFQSTTAFPMSIAKENFNEKLLKQFGRSVKTKTANYVEVLLKRHQIYRIENGSLFFAVFLKPVLLFSHPNFSLWGGVLPHPPKMIRYSFVFSCAIPWLNNKDFLQDVSSPFFQSKSSMGPPGHLEVCWLLLYEFLSQEKPS